MSLTRIDRIQVGHATGRAAATGCTVILFHDGAVPGCDIGGGASGTREIDACRPPHVTGKIHGLVLSGGSAFGLETASGVLRFLERRRVGHAVGAARIPVVPAAILYDLEVGRPDIRPDAAWGMRACRAASRRPVRSGNVGAGAGASVGKLFGTARATKGGLGNAYLPLPGGGAVAALAAVNAFGDVRHPVTGEILAGARASARSAVFVDTAASMERGEGRRVAPAPSTTLVVVATDVGLDRVQAGRLARQCQDGLARCINPVHTRFDGDIVFTASVGRRRCDPEILAVAACRAVGLAVVDAVESAGSLPGLPAARALRAAAAGRKTAFKGG